MAITDPAAIKFSNEQIRPLCEAVRALMARVGSAETDWFAGLNALFPNDAGESLEDGRDAEGVNKLTGADVNSVMVILLALKAANNGQIIAKPCVRPLQAS